MKETYQTENKVEYDLRFHQIASCKEKSEYNITIRKKQAPEMSQPVARESFQLVFLWSDLSFASFLGGEGGEGGKVLTKLAQQ